MSDLAKILGLSVFLTTLFTAGCRYEIRKADERDYQEREYLEITREPIPAPIFVVEFKNN